MSSLFEATNPGYAHAAGGRWRRRHNTELDGDNWFVVMSHREIQVI